MSVLPYIIEAQIALAMLWGVYRITMHRSGYFGLNRAWLLAIPALALLIPALSIPVWPASEAMNLVAQVGEIDAAAVSEAGTQLSWMAIYLAGVALLLAMSGVQIVRLWRIIRSAKSFIEIGGRRCLQTERVGRAASFCGRILINPAQLNDAELAQVVAHERAHATLGHSYDLLLAQLLCIALWWNPAVWLWRRNLRETHEFQADAAVVDSGVEASRYATLILQSLTAIRPGLASGFSYLTLKNRIIMLKKPHRGTAARSLFALPALMALVAAFSLSAHEPQTGGQIIISTRSGDADTLSVEVEPLILVDGQEIESVESVDIETIQSIDVLKDATATAQYGERGKNGVIRITLKK